MAPTPTFATYDPAEVKIILGGNPITGYADGTFVELEFDEVQWNKVTGADGHTSRSKTNNFTGTVTITLLSTSVGNDILNSLWQRDRRDNSGAVPFLLKDAQGNTVWSAEFAWVEQMPTQAYSKETEERAWTISTSNLSGAIGGNQLVA